MLIPVATLLVLAAAVISCVISPSPIRLVAVCVVAVIWILVNGPIEGPVLYRISENHGLTVADLAVLGVIPAGLSLLLSWSHRRSPSTEPLDKSAAKTGR